jgi:hypothetical protein
LNKTSVEKEKTTTAFNLALAAGILIMANGAALAVVAKWFIGIMPTLPGSSGNDPASLMELAAAGLVFGVIVLFGAIMLRVKPASKKAWGIMIAVFSLPSVIMGGGFIIGFILGIISGKIAFSEKTKLKQL